MAKLREIQDITVCESTNEMLTKGRQDGVSTAFDRADEMKPCPIGAQNACCKHCFMGPCRLSSKAPYEKVGVCGANIDTFQARGFAREALMVWCEAQLHALRILCHACLLCRKCLYLVFHIFLHRKTH